MRPRVFNSLLAIMIAIAAASSVLPGASATHNNQGTIKVHEGADEDPDQQNDPHVSCDFFVQGFKMGDDSGWLMFFVWAPTGNGDPITPTGDDLLWTANGGSAEDGWTFLSGPYSLPPGHYRVEAYTDDGHPGYDTGHFAKSKVFWVDECDDVIVPSPPPCPTDVAVRAAVVNGAPQIDLSWSAVADADEYVVYRAEGDGPLTELTRTTATALADADVTVGVTYTYVVTAVVDGAESANCDEVEATAVPFFGPILGALALAGLVGAFAWLRRR